MELLVTLALIVLVGVYIAWPIVMASPRPGASRPASRSPLEDLLREKEATLSAIRELEFDYQTGKLSAEDYQDLRSRYEAKAVAILQALDAAGKGTGLEETLEEEIRAFRRRKREAACEGCGGTLPPGARFCPHCGRAVAQGMRFPGIAAILFLLVLLALPAEAAPGVIQGRVVSKTGGARPIANIPVTLTTYVNEAEGEKVTATTDATGRFAFKGLPTGDGRSYVVQVKYKGGEYESPRLAFQGNEAVKTVEMTVYEPTNDPSVVRAGMHHIIVEVQEGALQIVELVVLVNQTDRTYIGATAMPDGRRETLRFSLARGAREVQYLDGLMECCVISKGDVLIDTMDVKPGTRQIAYGYLLPFTGSRASLERPLDIPTDTLEFLVPDIGVRVESPQLASKGFLETSSGRYLRYSGTRLKSGDRITIALEGLPAKARPYRALAFALILAFLGAVLTYPLLRRRSQAEKPSIQGEERRLDLLREIADLDDRFEAGELPEEEYRTLRAQRKAELIALSKTTHAGVSHNPAKEGER